MTGLLLLALFFIFLEVALVVAVAVLFSSASTPILSAVLTTVIFAAGRLSGWIPRLIEHLTGRGEAGTLKLLFLQVLYYVTPNLEILDLRDAAVNTGRMPGEIGWRLLYAAAYVAAMLLGAALIFRRRRF